MMKRSTVNSNSNTIDIHTNVQDKNLKMLKQLRKYTP